MANLLPDWKRQPTVVTRLPPLALSSIPLEISFDRTLPVNSFVQRKISSHNLFPRESYQLYEEEPLERYGDQTLLQGSVPTMIPTRANDEGDDFLQYYPYRPSLEHIYIPGSNSSRMYCREMSRSTAQPSLISTAVSIHHSAFTNVNLASSTPRPRYELKSTTGEISEDFRCSASSSSEGYATASSNRSCTSNESAYESNNLQFTNGSQNFESDRCSYDCLPPPAYADTSPEDTCTCDDEETCTTQTSNESVSDFFSQSENSSDFSEGTPPKMFDPSSRRNDENVVLMSLRNVQHSSDDITPVTSHCDCSLMTLPKFHAKSYLSTTRSPVAKRGRFPSSCENPTDIRTASSSQSLNLQRYCNEFAKDTYTWLSYQEATTHSIGHLFMSAQKPSGASHEDRRRVLISATSEMRKRRHTLEAVHLGAYILDKCLDSFHISKEALPDVCAVSMVLGTKMEEYDSLLPGTVNGLVGATRDKTRLCDIEKRIVYEMIDGFCFPTPLVFANYMLVELRCNEEQIRFAHYLLDLALLNSRFRDVGGPRVAHAAVCIASAIVAGGDSSFESECRTLLQAEQSLSELTNFPVGSTRDVMRGIMYEMAWALQERHSILIDYLSEDNKRVCFCEGSPALWYLICGVRSDFCEKRSAETEQEIKFCEF